MSPVPSKKSPVPTAAISAFSKVGVPDVTPFNRLAMNADSVLDTVLAKA